MKVHPNPEALQHALRQQDKEFMLLPEGKLEEMQKVRILSLVCENEHGVRFEAKITELLPPNHPQLAKLRDFFDLPENFMGATTELLPAPDEVTWG